MSSAAARHILVNTEEECLKLKNEIEGGTDFSESAKKHSKCPSDQYDKSKSVLPPISKGL